MNRDFMNACDAAMATLAHARAMVLMTYGDAGESFRSLKDDLQDDFLWALADRIEAARNAVASLYAAAASAADGAG